MNNGKGRIVNRTELADILGVALPTIDGYIRRGCPYVSKAEREKGIPWAFNTRDVVEWAKEEFFQQERGRRLW